MSTLAEGHRLGPYRIVRLLGEGAMGTVYDARQDPLGRRVALKLLRSEYTKGKDALAHYYNEARILSRLGHLSIAPASDLGRTPNGTVYVVTEYVPGESLACRLRVLDERHERLPVVTALQMARQVANILATVHEQGIVHRNLKPNNLMFVADPLAPSGERVKILDFGITNPIKRSDRGRVKSSLGLLIGSSMYMSPEQCASDGIVDGATDVYSLGCVLYQMLTGRPPFPAKDSEHLLEKHLLMTPAELASYAPKMNASVAMLVRWLLAKDKAQRPSMSWAAGHLGRLLIDLSGARQIGRSHPPTNTYPEATRALDTTPPPKTLGHLTGQRSQSAVKRNRVAQQASPLHVGDQVGCYRLVRLLGQGSMGIVFEAIDQIERRVAVKLVHPSQAPNLEQNRRLLAEAQAAKLILHPGLVTIYENGVLSDGNVYIVMEYLEGQTLSERLHDKRGKLRLEHAISITRQSAAALAAVHSQGFAHGDLKPGNLMLIPDPEQPGGDRVKLLDFGIAKICGADGEPPETQQIIGSTRYISPEQCKGSPLTVDRSDVYSLGLLLFEMATGESPYVLIGEELLSWSFAHVTMLPRTLHQLLPETPAELDDLLSAMLNKLPAERPTMFEVEQRLLACNQGLCASPQFSLDDKPALSVRAARASLPKRAARLLGVLLALVAALVLVNPTSRQAAVRMSHLSGTIFTLILLVGISCIVGTWAVMRWRYRRQTRPFIPSAPPANATAYRPLKLFCNYADQDRELAAALETSIALLKRQGIVASWGKSSIDAGSGIADEIARHMREADIILLLVSPDFMAHCIDCLDPAMERHRAGSVRVIPIILRPTDMVGAPFCELQSLPKNKKPVTSWSNPDEAWLDIAQGIRQVASRGGFAPL